ncbi:MAG: twin-arginine translocation signal domain-containing protein [Pseudohongiellaceae bacterium]
MTLSRRKFLAFTGTTAAGSAVLSGSMFLNPAHAAAGHQVRACVHGGDVFQLSNGGSGNTLDRPKCHSVLQGNLG